MKSAAAAGRAAREMVPILERGRESFRAVLARGGRADDIQQLSGDGVSIVTLEDFVANARLCQAYAQRVRTIKILDDDGDLSTLMCPDGQR